jgi:hypothetical protein
MATRHMTTIKTGLMSGLNPFYYGAVTVNKKEQYTNGHCMHVYSILVSCESGCEIAIVYELRTLPIGYQESFRIIKSITTKQSN